MSRPTSNPDVVRVHISQHLPIHARALGFADRIEIRFGQAFPITLVIDKPAVDPLMSAIKSCHDELEMSEHKEGIRGDQY